MAQMTAVMQETYGGPAVLALGETRRPEPATGQVLVRVRAAGLNAADWHIMRGLPLHGPALGRAARPARAGPRQRRRGRGRGRRRRGDALAGRRRGVRRARARRRRVRRVRRARRGAAWSRKPPTLSFEEAAAVPLAGRTALVCLREASRLADGQRLLVNGASGGVGTFAVQLGHALGAEVTGGVPDPQRRPGPLAGRQARRRLHARGRRRLRQHLRRGARPGRQPHACATCAGWSRPAECWCCPAAAVDGQAAGARPGLADAPRARSRRRS